MATRRQVISLYRKLLRESEKIPAYNIRAYAGRKIRDTFRTNKSIGDFIEIDKQIEVAKKSLELIHRQAIIGHLYTSERLVIERKKTLRPSDD